MEKILEITTSNDQDPNNFQDIEVIVNPDESMVALSGEFITIDPSRVVFANGEPIGILRTSEFED